MSRQRTSPIWMMSTEDFARVIRESKHYTEALSYFELHNKGNNHKTLKARIQEEGLDASHFRAGASAAILATLARSRHTLTTEELCREKSPHGGSVLRKHVMKHRLVPYVCQARGCQPEWGGQELVLVLDHINGDSCDHRIENLRFLCPNCNSQQATFAGRNNKHITTFWPQAVPTQPHLCKCGARITTLQSTHCVTCGHASRRKVERPPLEVLEQQIKEIGFLGTGRLYGVSDNAVRKWLKSSRGVVA